MAETAQQPQTIEINDAYFCQHFKEVVSSSFHQLSPPRTTPDGGAIIQCTDCSYDGREENEITIRTRALKHAYR